MFSRPTFTVLVAMVCSGFSAPSADVGEPKSEVSPPATTEASAGWAKIKDNPVLGGKLGTCFDVAVLKEKDIFRMWFSWRPKKSVALVESADGIHWSEPVTVLGPNTNTSWEADINRPIVARRDDRYQMWYTGQAGGHSWIGYATSADGKSWTRMSKDPVLSAEQPWEKVAVMCPHVLWDEKERLYKMWYSGGEQNEPNAIGFATSKDGLQWIKHPDNPIFRPDKNHRWEQDRVTACQVIREGGGYVMFYIGFENESFAQIGLARSRDGLTDWQRHPANPILRARTANRDAWDFDAVYKPFAIYDQGRWLLWYNGRRGGVEQIGLAIHQGRDLWPGVPPAPRAEVLDRAELSSVYGNDAGWFREQIPFFECPDRDIQQTYYFRWKVFREHIRETPDGFVITEFLPPVGWAGKHNTISCAAGHHIYEGRWLHDPKIIRDYASFWFRKGGDPRRYSFWAADAIYAAYTAQHDRQWMIDLLPDLVRNFAGWEKARRDPNGLFWQNDGEDGMEVSIGGSGYRATINSYLFGEAQAIAKIARLAGNDDLAKEFRAKAVTIKQLTQTKLWDDQAKFFKVLPRTENATLADVRELHGYTPWYFNLPDARYAVAWNQLMDPQGFYAPFGATTAERRHPRFRFEHEHECLWNGPSWPYATAVTLTALANLLNNCEQEFVGKKDYLELLRIYARSQRLKLADGTVIPWIDEDLDADTGEWIARRILEKRGVKDRGKDYNHSTFCDLVITGLVGLRPRADDVVEVNPLLPEGAWEYFCLANVPYHGRTLTILWDKTGMKYGKGRGLRVFADGAETAVSESLQRVSRELPRHANAHADATDR